MLHCIAHGAFCRQGREPRRRSLRALSHLQLDPRLVAVGELDAGGFESPFERLHLVQWKDTSAKLIVAEPVYWQPSTRREAIARPAQELPRRPDLLTGDHSLHPSFSAFSCSALFRAVGGENHARLLLRIPEVGLSLNVAEGAGPWHASPPTPICLASCMNAPPSCSQAFPGNLPSGRALPTSWTSSE